METAKRRTKNPGTTGMHWVPCDGAGTEVQVDPSRHGMVECPGCGTDHRVFGLRSEGKSFYGRVVLHGSLVAVEPKETTARKRAPRKGGKTLR